MGFPYRVVMGWGMGRIVSKKELAELLGVSERTLTEWQQKGMPIKIQTARGHANEYDTADVFNWRVEFVANGQQRETARERRDRLEGDRLQIQLAREAGQFLVAEEVREALVGAIATARSHFMRSPRVLKKKLDREYGIDIDLELLLEHARATLAELADNVPSIDPAGGGKSVDGDADDAVDEWAD